MCEQMSVGEIQFFLSLAFAEIAGRSEVKRSAASRLQFAGFAEIVFVNSMWNNAKPACNCLFCFISPSLRETN